MSDLLASDFNRLLKSQAFHATLIFCLECLIIEVIISGIEKYLTIEFLKTLMSTNYAVVGIILAVFISVFIGSEYSNGTMRNKLIAGYSRPAIYISDFTVCIIAGFIIQAIYVIALFIMSFILFNQSLFSGKTPEEIAIRTAIIEKQLIGFYVIAAYTAIFLLISMLTGSKSRAIATSMATAIVMFLLGTAVYQNISQQNMAVVNSYQSVQQLEKSESENFFSEIKSTVYLFSYDFLPSCQAEALTKVPLKESPPHASKYVLYDLGIVIVTTGLGVLLLSKKDLK